MTERFQIKKCEICDSSCRPLTSMNNPEASEWYCVKCRKSYKMTEREDMIVKANNAKTPR